jgi:hypothetical protein
MLKEKFEDKVPGKFRALTLCVCILLAVLTCEESSFWFQRIYNLKYNLPGLKPVSWHSNPVLVGHLLWNLGKIFTYKVGKITYNSKDSMMKIKFSEIVHLAFGRCLISTSLLPLLLPVVVRKFRWEHHEKAPNRKPETQKVFSKCWIWIWVPKV